MGGNYKILSHLVGKQTMWFPNRPDTNRPVQSQKMAIETGNFGFRKKRNCSIRVAKTKALISFAVTATDLHLCFRLGRLLVFP